MKLALRLLLAALMVVAGTLHFTRPEGFTRIVPAWLPAPLALVYVSGFFEVLFGALLVVPATQRTAAFGLIALFIAVFPANVNMATHHLGFGGGPPRQWILWARLPLQAVLIAWAFWLRQ